MTIVYRKTGLKRWYLIYQMIIKFGTEKTRNSYSKAKI